MPSSKTVKQNPSCKNGAVHRMLPCPILEVPASELLERIGLQSSSRLDMSRRVLRATFASVLTKKATACRKCGLPRVKVSRRIGPTSHLLFLHPHTPCALTARSEARRLDPEGHIRSLDSYFLQPSHNESMERWVLSSARDPPPSTHICCGSWRRHRGRGLWV